MYRGVPYILLSNIFMILIGYSIKSLSHVAFYNLVLIRAFFGCLICYTTIYYLKISPFGNNKKLLITRGITGAGAIILFYITLQTLPLTLAMSLQYLSPIFTVLFTLLLTGIKPQKRQLFALFGSLIGTWIIYNITTEELSNYAILAMLSALLAGASYANIGILKETEHTMVISFYFAVITLITVAPYSLANFQHMTTEELLFACFAALCSIPSQLLLTKAYQLSSVYIIAPLTYLNIVFASIVGYVFWQEVVSFTTYLGVFLIIACNLIMLKPSKQNSASVDNNSAQIS